MYFDFEDAEHTKRERFRAQELRKSSWWKQELGRGICYHCQKRFSGPALKALTMDHLTPIARGGRSTKNNCVVSCKECNSRKGHLMAVEQTFLALEAEKEARK